MIKNFKSLTHSMKLIVFGALFILSFSANSNPTEFVNPFLGTDFHGHTFPGAALPGGMVQLSPDTDTQGWDWCSGYHYSDSSVMGFSHLHRSGMGAGDWGDILFMPTIGEIKTIPGAKDKPGEGYRSRFSHDDEKASPGYYTVKLKDYGIKAELTVSERAGYHKYTFPKSDASHILIDLNHGIHDRCSGADVKIVSTTEIEGHRLSNGFVDDQNVYFYAKFSKPFKSSGTWDNGKVNLGSKEQSGKSIGAFADFVTSEGEIVEVKVGISYTSIAQARLNFEKEISNKDFEGTKAAAAARWNVALSKIEVQLEKGADPTYVKNKMITFYSAVYHSLLFPATFSDVDGKYMGLDKQVHTANGFTYRSDFSLWDTFRAEMPLLTLIHPERSNDVVNTMIAQYEQGGWLPTPQEFGNSYTNDMIGDHPVVAILDAYRKGIKKFDLQKAYAAVRKNAMETPPVGHRSEGRAGLQFYLNLGYLPYDKIKESVSQTLEYAFNDWCVAQLAKEAGHMADYEMFMKRAYNYKNIFDRQSGFARPKNSEGKWLEPFDPKFVGHGKDRHYTEANAWQYTLFVPHDVKGLMALEGGQKNFLAKLDTLFTTSSDVKSTVVDITGLIGQYAHGNEPGHHTAYLYSYAGAPWKTQEMVRTITDSLYSEGPAGLCGNEDMGQMSAWYVLSTMGIYQVAPGQNIYAIGSPTFSNVTIHLDKTFGNTGDFVIEAKNNSKLNKYIQSATLNGKPLTKTWFDHLVVKNGGKLTLVMGPKPNKTWAISIVDAPPSMSK